MSQRQCELDGCDRDYLAKGMCRLHYERVRSHGDPQTVQNWHGMSLEDRFWLSVERGHDDECWEWQRTRLRFGYGQIWLGTKALKAHRVAWELHHGSIPDGMNVLHRCDNPPCVNPAHLWLGTNSDNIADKVGKGRCASMPGDTNPSARLCLDDVRAIRSDARPAVAVAAEYGVSGTQVRRIRAGQSWSHVA